MKVYIKNPTIQGAWKWIQEGYRRAWAEVGYDAVYYDTLDDIDEKEYILMVREWDIKTHKDLKTIEKASLAFLFAQPQVFPAPWGTHPNFKSCMSNDAINIINSMENVYLWTFGYVNPEFHRAWKTVHTVLLAFDSLSYQPAPNEQYAKYDISFVGGWANNGFDEKRKIMMENFIEFKKSGLNCGFFVNKNLTHQQETALLSSSKITLNLHDAYQRILGYDTNERTFKSLGLNGLLLSDKVRQLELFFPEVKTSNDPQELIAWTREYLSMNPETLNELKAENRQMILDNHCYTNRVIQLLSIGGHK